MQALTEIEMREGGEVGVYLFLGEMCMKWYKQQYDVILLGGLSGRLDQTIHTMSALHKLRKTRKKVFAVTDDNIAWILDEVPISGSIAEQIAHVTRYPRASMRLL